MKFEDIIAPISKKEFFADYYGKKYLLVRASHRDKFAKILDWQIFNHILSITQNWDSKTLNLVQDEVPIAPKDYCRQDLNRAHQPVWVPLADKIMQFVHRGASLVCNEVDSLTPAMAQVANDIEVEFNARAQANIYCSRQGRQAFKAHFDTHEVFVMHCEGTKIWHIYEGGLVNPIRHEEFKNLSPEKRQAITGKISAEFTLNRGDFLYVPRGMIHDALANDEYSLHITFGASQLLGADLISAMADYFFRHNEKIRTATPLTAQGDKAYIKEIAHEFSEFFASNHPIDMLAQLRAQRGFVRNPVCLPVDAKSVKYQLLINNAQIKKIQGQAVLIVHDKSVPVPIKYEKAMEFIIKSSEFNEKSLEKFLPESQIAEFIRDLTNMKII